MTLEKRMRESAHLLDFTHPDAAELVFAAADRLADTPTEEDLVDAILAHQADEAAEYAVRRIHARIGELQPLLGFGGSLGAVYAAEIQGLRFALELLENTDPH